MVMGFRGGASGKEPACQYRRHKQHGFNPLVWKIPWRRAWQPTPLENPMDRGGWLATVHSVVKSWTWLKRLGTHACVNASGRSDSKFKQKSKERLIRLTSMKSKGIEGLDHRRNVSCLFDECKITGFSSFSASKYFWIEQLGVLKRDIIQFCFSWKLMKTTFYLLWNWNCSPYCYS